MKIKLLLCLCWMTINVCAQTEVDSLALADSLYYQGSELNISGEYEQGLKNALIIQGIYQRHGQWRRYFRARNMELNFCNELGQQEKSWELYEANIQDIREKLGQSTEAEATAHTYAGDIYYYYEQNYEEALTYYDKAYQILKSLKEVDVTVADVIYERLSEIHMSINAYDEALKYSEEAVELIKKQVPPSERQDKFISSHYRMMGDLYQYQGALQKGIEYQKKALQLYINVYGKEHIRTGVIYHSLAEAYRLIYEHDLAIEYNEKALAIFLEQLGDKHDYVAITYNNLGNIYITKKKYQKSIDYFLKTVKIAQLTGAEDVDYLAIAYVNLGLANDNLGNYKASIAYMQKALELDLEAFGAHHIEVAKDYNMLATSYANRGLWEQALEYNAAATFSNTVAYESSNPYDFKTVIDSATFFTDVYLTQEILARKSKILYELYAETGNQDLLKIVFEGTMAQLKLIDQAKQQLFGAEDQIDFSKTINRVYETGILVGIKLYELTADKSYLRKAFVLAEKNKSETLANVLQSNSAIQIGNIPDSLRVQEQELKEAVAELEYFLIEAQLAGEEEEMAAVENELFEVKRSLEAWTANLEQGYPQYYKVKYAVDYIEAADVQTNILEEGKLLLEYFVGDSTVYLFALSSDNIDCYTLCTKREMQRMVKRLRGSLTNLKVLGTKPKASYEAYGRYAYEFYETLVKPALEKHTARELIVIPDDFLGFIPFEAILTEPIKQTGDDGQYGALTYLLLNYITTYAYSARLLQSGQVVEKTGNNQQILAFAASYTEQSTNNGKRKGLKSLPSAIAEVQRLEEAYVGAFFYDDQANETSFRAEAEHYSVIHLAMHGLLDGKHPELSSLAFTKGSDSLVADDFLYAHEISNLSIGADLVVLSACETGYGKFEKGEGVMSLARSFMYAGVPSLVVSLWQVSDDATAILMELFYENLVKGMTKSEALHHAKLTYLTEVSKGIATHPNFWAAFVHLGKDGVIELAPKTKPRMQWLIFLGTFLLVLGMLWWFLKKKKTEKPSV